MACLGVPNDRVSALFFVLGIAFLARRARILEVPGTSKLTSSSSALAKANITEVFPRNSLIKVPPLRDPDLLPRTERKRGSEGLGEPERIPPLAER